MLLSEEFALGISLKLHLLLKGSRNRQRETERALSCLLLANPAIPGTDPASCLPHEGRQAPWPSSQQRSWRDTLHQTCQGKQSPAFCCLGPPFGDVVEWCGCTCVAVEESSPSPLGTWRDGGTTVELGGSLGAIIGQAHN